MAEFNRPKKPVLVDHTGKPFPMRGGKPVPDGDAKPGGIMLPSGWLFVARVGGGDNTMWLDRFDEAMRASRSDANDMLRDCSIRAMVEERMGAFTSLKWHLEVPDEKDPEQVRVKDGLTRLAKGVRSLQSRIIPQLAWGCWYGRSGVQCEWEWVKLRDETPEQEEDADKASLQMMRHDHILRCLKNAVMRDPEDKTAQLALADRREELGVPRAPQMKKKQSGGRFIKGLSIRQAFPVRGDKIGHQYDGTPFVLVNSSKSTELPAASIVSTTMGRALSLRGTWRDRFLISKWWMEDRDFFAPDEAEALYGTGLRDHCYWMWWLRQDWLGSITEFFSRVGMGVNLWKYSAGNPQALAAVQKAAGENTDRANIFVPVVEGEESLDTLTRVEVPTSGAESLLKLIEYADKAIERKIVGQEGSASATSSSGHSNKSSTEFQQETKGNNTRQDATWCSEPLTGSPDEPGMLSIMHRGTYPETYGEFPVSFVFDLDSKESQEKLTAIKTLVDMGVEVKKADARDAAGVSAPADGDEVIQPPAPPGGAEGAPQPGGDPAAGGADPLAAMMGGPGGKPGAAPAPEPKGDVDENGLPKPPPGLPPLAPEQERDFEGPLRHAKEKKRAVGYAGFDIPEPLAGEIRQMAKKIKKADLHPEEGLEENPHVTALFGFDPQVPVEEVRKALAGCGPVKARLGRVSLFLAKGDHDFDVVKIEMESPDLHEVHEALGSLPHTDNYPDYKPHLTLGYVKAGRGAYYEGKEGKHPLLGRRVLLDRLTYNSPDRESEEITLGEGDGPRRHAREDSKHHLHSEKDGKFVAKGKEEGAVADSQKNKPTNPAPTGEPSAKPKGEEDPERTTPPGGLAKQVRAAGGSEREMSDEERRESLAHTPVRRSDILGGGCNETRLLELEDGTVGIYKPSRGERSGLRAGVRGGTYYRREVAASRVARIMGMGDLVPETVFRKQGITEGSCQQYIPGAREACELPESERYDGEGNASRAAAFDYLIGHLDRHTGNWMLKEGKMYDLSKAFEDAARMRREDPLPNDEPMLIDNGLAFPEHYDKRDFLNARFLRRLAKKNRPLPDLTAYRDKWTEIADALDECGLEPEAIGLTHERFMALTAKAGLRVRDLPGPGGSDMDEIVLRPIVNRTQAPAGGRTGKQL